MIHSLSLESHCIHPLFVYLEKGDEHEAHTGRIKHLSHVYILTAVLYYLDSEDTLVINPRFSSELCVECGG